MAPLIDRRALLTVVGGMLGNSALPSWAQTTPPTPESNGPPSGTPPQAVQPLVVDCSVNCEAAARSLAKRGVKVVFRYYGRDPAQPGYPNKRLTQSEALAIHNAKMAIGLTYQRNNGAISSFSQDEAKMAADYCIGRDAGMNPGKPEVIHHPKGTVIYFGIDTNEFESAQYDIAAAYFRTIKQRFKESHAPFEVGVYGSGLSCDQMRKMAGVNYYWLAGVSTGWEGTAGFYNKSSANWNLFQNALEVPLDVPVDTNLVNPKALGKIGAFDENGLLGSLDDTAVRNTLRFVKVKPALFYKSPNGERLIHVVEYDDKRGHHVEARDYIEFGRMVTLLESGPEWSKVEVTFVRNNVGTAYQGYIRSDMLTSIEKIP